MLALFRVPPGWLQRGCAGRLARLRKGAQRLANMLNFALETPEYLNAHTVQIQQMRIPIGESFG